MTTCITRCAFVAALTLLASAPLIAQGLPEPGQRVRVHLVPQPRAVEGAVSPQRLRGTLVGVTADSLALQIHPASDVTWIARAGIKRLDLSGGVRSRFESALVHGAVTAVMGSLQRTLFAALDRDRYSNESLGESDLVGAAGGAVIGITIGALFPQERWARLRSW